MSPPLGYLHFFGEPYLAPLHPQKGEELFAVYNFLLNDTDIELVRSAFRADPEEPADIEYAERKFQVTSGSPSADAVINILSKEDIASVGNVGGEVLYLDGIRTRTYHSTSSVAESIENEILTPLARKVTRYGEGNPVLVDVDLLIYSYAGIVTFLDESGWENIRLAHKQAFVRSGFGRIYLADQSKNIRLH